VFGRKPLDFESEDGSMDGLDSQKIKTTIDSMKLRRKAWLFAANRHAGQLYPGSSLPYITHVGEVALNLLPGLAADPGLDADLAVLLAILHDTVEDTGATPELLGTEFGPEVARGVSALSKRKGLPKGEAMEDSLRRIRECQREAWLVKMADRIANLGPEPPFHIWSREKCLAYAEEGRLILEALGEASPTLAQVLGERVALWREEAGKAAPEAGA
jgi:(p)ppGpp synthase/HD superfamily hydrolase